MLETITLHMSKGDYQSAKLAAEKYVFEHPTNHVAQAYLGLCHFHQQHWEEAKVCFDKATRLNPKYWEAGLKTAQCLDRLLRFDEVYDTAVHWQTIEPNDRTLNSLVNSLSHHITPRITDSYQKSIYKPNHIVEFTN